MNLQYRRPRLTATSDLRGHPLSPYRFIGADNELVAATNEREPEEKGFLDELFQPAVVRKLRIAKAELGEALRVSIDESRDAELLRETPELTERCGSLHQIDEMSLYSPFRKKTQGLTRFRTFLDAENLYFHRVTGSLGRMMKRIHGLSAIDAR